MTSTSYYNFFFRTLSIQFNNSASEANNGHVSHQVQCYGLEFPDQCEKYYGPHSTECLETIWASAKCLVSGRRHPTKLSAADHTRIDKLNLRQVMNETGTTRGASDLGNKKSQVDCFGLVYPDKCTNYYGPHPVECLVTMWLSATCVLQGYKYPEKLSTARLKELDSWNLRQISGYFNGTALSADSGSLINQTYCYGMEYPSKCVKYYGPHSLECLKTLWDYAHCTPDGKSYPAKISTAERSRLELMDIRQIISEFNGTKTSADSGVAASQMSCFGLEYPGGCDTYYGAYSETCLLTLWDSVGCVADGTEYPSKLAKSAIDSFTGLGLRLLVSLFNKSAISADMGDVSHQKKCFGMVYPDGCNNYYGPHSVTCLETIWKSVDCLYEGTRYPSKLGSAEYARINALNLRQVIGETNTTRRLSDNGDSESQMECFGLVYPKGCIKYYGSHPIDCLVTMWTTATCVSQGYKYPRKLSNSRLKELDTWDIRKISAFFNTTALSADSGSLVSQTYCFGMEYPTHCTKYYGPHPLECLETLWDYAHCIPEGNAYPTKIPSTELTRHDSMNLREIINEFNGTKSSADSGNRTSQLRCFGLEYPPGCDTYYGGYSNPCLITLWDSVRCLPEGTEYPLKPKAIDAFTGMGLRPVIALFNNSAVSADDGDVSHQMKCFGMEYPDDCKKYYGPHPSTCLETIWNTAGCLPEGLRFPSKLDSTEHARIDNLNLRQVIGETNTTRRLSDSGNSRSQMECFGLVYPEDCVKYYGPHPVDCLVTIWTTATCVSQGYKYPRKLSNSRLKELDTWNIRQISASFNATALSADSGSLVSQTYCFGMEYPTHCTKYYGPHPLKCLETLWDYAHCIPEGNAYPTKIPSGELTRHDSMNLREIINEFNSTKSSADSGNRTSQLRCFGLEYPSGCETYYGAYSIPCLITLWESVGCVPEGTKYPPKLTPTSVNVFTGMGLRALGDLFNNSAYEANNGDVTHQQECYGLVFPDECEKYYGPHPTGCLETIWSTAECLAEGARYPSKLPALEHTRIDSLNLRQVINETSTTRNTADSGNRKSQVNCFGLVYPDGCTNYYGPHPMQCLVTMWISATCVEQGYKYPEKLSKTRLNQLDTWTIRNISQFFNDTALSADSGSLVNQTYCFGMEYPNKCTKYYGPNPLKCLETLWNYAHCISEGDAHPVKISSSELARHDAMNLRQIINEFNVTKSSADSGNRTSQMRCFGIEYPSGCDTYYGAYSKPCLVTLWDMVRCLPEGTEYPSKLTPKSINSFTGMGLRPVIAVFNNSAISADNGDVSHQMKCFGMEYPDDCKKYYGPHPTPCLETIWGTAKCLPEGTRFPSKLNSTEHARIDNLNLRQVIGETNRTRRLSDSGDSKSQMECFGLVYPKDCIKYYGPHPVDCLVTMWATATCVSQGYKYPRKLSNSRLKELDTWNIRQISAFFNTTAISADSGSLVSQTYCFGMEYPTHCTKYYGPHPLECLETLWDYAHCIPEGNAYPTKIPSSELTRHNSMNLREIINEFNDTKSSADSGNRTSQLRCFGLEYPPGCDTYYGGYSNPCLITLWDSVRCLPEGTEYPPKLKPKDINAFIGMGLRPVIALFNNSAISADNGDVSHQLKCFGMEYPDDCKKYYGPHPTTCLDTIWDTAKCLPEGTRFPSKLNSTEHARIDNLNLRQVIEETNTTRRLSDSGNSKSQMECFGLVYPEDCIKYYGPHPVDCLVTMWTTATCVSQGYKYPKKLSNSRLKELDTWNIRQISASFNATALSADSGSLVSQTYCFGMEYPTHCTKYYGPHPLKCLETLWDYAHCIPEGTAYPTKIPSSELTRHDSMNLREIINEFNSTKSSADLGNRTSQLRCFGLEYPSGCETYYGAYSIPCLITLWDSVRCVTEGTEYPPKLTPTSVNTFTGMGLRPLTALFNYSAISADNGDVSYQWKCFGMKYPDHCEKYYGPHPTKCLEKIWNSTMCLPEGTRFPIKLNASEHARIDNLNLRQIIRESNTTRRLSDNGDSKSQLECFGLVYPDSCIKYYGPHPVDCLVTMWTTATCVSQGYKHPTKLSSARLKKLDTWNIREISSFFNGTALSADSGSLVNQTYCFGLEYPEHCTKYYGPHHKECLETLWNYAHCIYEGMLIQQKFLPVN